MTTKDLKILIPKFLTRLSQDGHSKEVKSTNKWILHHFQQYCIDNCINQINMEVISIFLKKQYDIQILNPLSASQIAIRRPLLIFWEYSLTGTYEKSHLAEKTKVPIVFNDLYLKYRSYINSLGLSLLTKRAKMRFTKHFLSYIDQENIKDISTINKQLIYDYINSNIAYSTTTKQTVIYNLRSMLNWMHDQKMITFNGNEMFPIIKVVQKRFIPSCYKSEEIRKILDSVDTNTIYGKHDYLILSLLIYYGLRTGDIIDLKYENFNWSNNTITIIQKKTRKLLTLPLIDEVKFPLLDYLKNARYPVEDDHILITLCAPYTCYKNQSFQRVVTKYMNKAGVQYSNKHHGTHALRHSLASGLLNEKVPISAISGILGHSCISTTNTYLTIDVKNLKEISLEVPYVSNSKI